jgi:Universal stress protein family
MGVNTGYRGTDVSTGQGAAGRPVLLATMGVPLDEEATVFAVDTAVESGQRLVMANVTTLEPLRMSITLGYDALPELTPEVSASLRRSAELARSLGVHVERLRVRSPRPVQALLDLVADVRPGLLVFGPDRRALRERRYRKALGAVRDRVTCLLWVPSDAAGRS